MTRIFLFSLINFTNITNILIFLPQITQFFYYAQDFSVWRPKERTNHASLLTKKTHTLYIRYALFVFSGYINSNKSHNAMV